MFNEIQVNQEVGRRSICQKGGYCSNNGSTIKNSNYKYNIADLKDVIFAQGRPSEVGKFEDPDKVLIRYINNEYYYSVYLGQETRYGNVLDLSLPTKPKKNNNK